MTLDPTYALRATKVIGEIAEVVDGEVYVPGWMDLPVPGDYDLVIETFTASGNWTPPVEKATLEVWGAGGGSTQNVGGGGGGAYARTHATGLDTATPLTVTVGTSATDTDGGSSSIGALVVALGGKSGTNGGAGGLASGCTGDVAYDGASGAQGTGNQNGGGAAGDKEAGGAGFLGGASNGGMGGTTTNQAAAPGGGWRSGTSVEAAGSRGEARVTYLMPSRSGYPIVKRRVWGRDETSATTRTIQVPRALPGDLLLLMWAARGDDDGAGDHELDDANWTRLDIDSSGTETTAAVFYLEVGEDTEVADVVLTTTDSSLGAWVVMRIRGGSVPTLTAANGNTVTPSPPVHTAAAIAKRLWLGFSAFSNSQGGLDTAATVTKGEGYESLLVHQGASSGRTTACVIVQETKHDDLGERAPVATVANAAEWAAFTIEITSDEDPATDGELAAVLALSPDSRWQHMQGYTLASGEVDTWEDLIGTRHFSAPSSGQRPLPTDTGLSFDGVSDRLDSDANNLDDFDSTPFEWIFVASGSITAGNTSATLGRLQVVGPTACSYNAASNLTFGSDTTLQVFSLGHDGVDAFATRNGTVLDTATTGTINFTSMPISFGAFESTYGAMYLRESFLWLGSSLSPDDRQVVIDYAAERYGL